MYRLSASAILRWNRFQKDMTLAEISRKTGLSLQYISEMERGEKEPSEKSLNLVCQAMGISFDESNVGFTRGKNHLNQLFTYLENVDERMLLEMCDSFSVDENRYSLSFMYDILVRAGLDLIVRKNSEQFEAVSKFLGKYFEECDNELNGYFCHLKALYNEQKNNLNDALRYALRSVEHGCHDVYYRSYLACLYMKNGELIKALDESEKCLSESQREMKFQMTQLIRMNQALIYVYLRQYRDALETLKICRNSAVSMKNYDMVSKCDINYVKTCLISGLDDEAEQYCYNHFRKDDELYAFVTEYMRIRNGQNKYELDTGKSNRLLKTLSQFDKHIDMQWIERQCKHICNDGFEQILFLKYCIQISEERGNYEVSLHCHDLLDHITYL